MTHTALTVVVTAMTNNQLEERHPTDILQLLPKDGVRCGDGQRVGDWSPCGGYAKTIAKKKECNMYECPYHKWDPADHWG